MNYKHQNKLRVGVLMGGRSIECEVSFNSGRTICDHIYSIKYEIIPIFQTQLGKLYILPWRFLHRGKISDFLSRLDNEAKSITWDDIKKRIDFIYIAVHGRYAEDGVLQGCLEVLGIPYMGTKVFGSAIGMNKIMQKKLLTASDIHVPRGIDIFESDYKKGLPTIMKKLEITNLSFPFIVKPNSEGSSLGVSFVKNTTNLMLAVENALYCDKRQKQTVLIEEKIEGREITFVGLQYNGKWKALPLTEVIIEKGSTFYDYDQKYMPGRATKETHAKLTTKETQLINKTCILAATVLNFKTIVRIDSFLTNDGDVVIFDSNSISGMGPSSFVFHQAAVAGINHTQFINHLIEEEMSSDYTFFAGAKKDTKERVVMKKQKKIRIAVLLGGESNEREISLESGRNVCYKLLPDKYNVTPLFVTKKMELFKLSHKLLIKNSTHEIVPFLEEKFKVGWSEISNLFDFVFIALHGGKGEDGSVQGMLEMLDMPYNGSATLASSICIDKYRTNSFLHSQGFSVPKNILIKKNEWKKIDLKSKIKDIPFPVVVKPPDDGCSMFVTKCHSEKELKNILQKYFENEKKIALVEEHIKGQELTVGIVGNEKTMLLPTSLVIATRGGMLSIEDKFLPGHGGNQTPAPFDEYQQSLVLHTVSEVYKTLGCKGYARIDCFYQTKKESGKDEDKVIILEVNTLPGLTPATCLFHQAAEIGIRPVEFIDLIVQLGFENHKSKVLKKQQSFDVTVDIDSIIKGSMQAC